MSPWTLVFHSNEYLHHEFLAALRFPSTNGVYILEVLSSRTVTMSSVIAYRRPQRSILSLFGVPIYQNEATLIF